MCSQIQIVNLEFAFGNCTRQQLSHPTRCQIWARIVECAGQGRKASGFGDRQPIDTDKRRNAKADVIKPSTLRPFASFDLQAENGGSRSTDALGDFNLVPELVNISRRNEERVNIAQGFLAAGTLPSVVQTAFEKKLADFELPPGYRTEYGGELAEQSQAVGNLLIYVPLLVRKIRFLSGLPSICRYSCSADLQTFQQQNR